MEVSGSGTEQLRVRRETLQAMLDRCQRALESLRNADDRDVPEEAGDDPPASPCGATDSETDALYDLVKSSVESPNFLEKLGSIHMSASQYLAVGDVITEDSNTWDVVDDKDLWEVQNDGPDESNQEGYVLVRQEDIVESVACFMAAYLLSLQQTKELTPNQLQEALSNTFSVKKKKGKLQKVWERSKVVYNVASWGATAIGIYQNPAIFRVASAAFLTSCRVISKLL